MAPKNQLAAGPSKPRATARATAKPPTRSTRQSQQPESSNAAAGPSTAVELPVPQRSRGRKRKDVVPVPADIVPEAQTVLEQTQGAHTRESMRVKAPATPDARQLMVKHTAASLLKEAANDDHLEAFETPGAHRYRRLDQDDNERLSAVARSFRILRDSNNDIPPVELSAASVKRTFFTFDNNDFEEVQSHDINRADDGELILGSMHVDGNQVTITPANLRRSARVPTPAHNRLPKTLGGKDAPDYGRKQWVVQFDDDDDIFDDVADDEEDEDNVDIDIDENEDNVDTEEDDDDEEEEEEEPIAPPKKGKGKQAKETAPKPRPQAVPSKRRGGKGGKRRKQVAAPESPGENFDFSDNDSELLPQGTLPPPICTAGTRVFREDKPHVFKVYAADLVPFLELQPNKTEASCVFCLKLRKENPAQHVTKYTEGSSTGTMRPHFWDKHAHEWISACDNANPPIKIGGRQGDLAITYLS
ncbi:hypothetical protein PQX77_018685 [Marasmius sp. AFHP31]|nr:hypothetical protein PQX77_018685 [Marasmius sp. AFHP31]